MEANSSKKQKIELVDEIATSVTTYQGHKQILDQKWKAVLKSHTTMDNCWEKYPDKTGIEANPDEYLVIRWNKEKLSDDGEPMKRVRVVDKDGRTSFTKVYTKMTFYLHVLAYLQANQQIFSSRVHNQNGKPISVRYDVSHLCANRRCHNPAHLVNEPHSVNMSRIGCYSIICVHQPQCLTKADDKKKRVTTLYQKLGPPVSIN